MAITCSHYVATGECKGSSIFKEGPAHTRITHVVCLCMLECPYWSENCQNSFDCCSSGRFVGSGPVVVSCRRGAKYLALVVLYRSDSRYLSKLNNNNIICIIIYLISSLYLPISLLSWISRREQWQFLSLDAA